MLRVPFTSHICQLCHSLRDIAHSSSFLQSAMQAMQTPCPTLPAAV